MRWLRLFFSGSLVGVAFALGACADSSEAHGVSSDAGVGGSGGSAGSSGVDGGGVSGSAGGCSEVTPESVGCAARYEDQVKETALTYGACGSYFAWLSLGPPAVVCIYDMNSDLVYWRSCENAPVACGTGAGNACHANGLGAPNGPACFLPGPMRPVSSDAGGGVTGDAGLYDAGRNGAGDAAVDDAGPTDAG